MEKDIENIIAHTLIVSCAKKAPEIAAKKIVEYLKRNYNLKPL